MHTIVPPKRETPTHPEKSGFTVIELAIVVTIIAILAALAIPYYKHIRQSAQISALENDFRIYKQELSMYAAEHEAYPPSQPIPGRYPEGMADRMSPKWKDPSPIGGEYRWVYTTEQAPQDRSAYIEVVNSASFPINIDTDRLVKIDKDLDDGDISSGRLQLFGLNIRYYVTQ